MARCARHGTPGSASARGVLRRSLQRLSDATPALTEAAREVAPLGVVLADAQFDSEQKNHRHVHERLGAVSVIPAKRGKATWRLQGYRAQMRIAFPSRLYRRRALVESVFSAVKRKLSARAPGRSLETQRIQALLLGLGQIDI